ncbi:cupin-like domain-containing protein [Altibacter sp. HG106]|uniref:cupin-like domain-containing protein n=1 Tax=Altibacter sp. HG106 TaxID=3023937 RepID=UPI0023504241|nr:cupin-like domain-containing protein [Altibacter sp. HG106]MDC7995203.1 cupin-like domain-containing protein [Altibacter sp. HG106]
MTLHPIDRHESLTKTEFLEHYFKPQKPVILERAIEDWPAFEKWDLAYIKSKAGDKEVPLYDDRPVSHEDGFNEPHATMKMAEYIELLQKEPTKYRIFLWNVLKEVPELQQDYHWPDFGLRLMKKLPMLFFGGQDSYTFMHYDIDLANIFHFHFHGEKEVILFDQSQNDYLYKIPHSLIVREDIDFKNPDYDKWPALRKAEGFTGKLSHGQVLYMPEGYWHYMRYITPGFSMSLRAIARNPKNLGKALYNVLIMRHFDTLMRRWKGQAWIDAKNQKAIDRTHAKLGLSS